ncbi:ribonuclease E inhibitor RraB [Tropicibacter naphthalenivorans]|uniref:Regulator of ribonuclease activity B domain-containing protein n=1 Tax=Tropicibacter naphthalenivorans TaxID=441103 RepID=A0A0N7M0E9_9RHOB|nr:ribonuclease E inhibitor RraB [Tropicibacter naphthalenivorans]CUH80273.1 hypothetical protein TRN7648_02905 [Tropicibacter naphthalenivorans]SMC85712.1 Regulator of ribonuclease activity B [Tropicibacter naphthalenivorans]
MSQGAAQIAPSQALVEENTAMLSSFEQQGMRLDQEVWMDFIAEFPDPELAESALGAAERMVKAAGTLPTARFEILVDDADETAEPVYELRLTTRVLPEAAIISTFEALLTRVSTMYGGSTAAWEFADPTNTTMEALQ